ncbi:uncharacterized protein LOC121740560 [Aricia agestis]|uniref:uncharacterized protein LOC121740560 n=1 Tax=Aricia agestis TaxID=91739 RepID=UPI001C205541|nr:uncharacterized protein LOC121740560 [Aricia agestis]
MALILLQVLVLAVTAGAVDDVGVRWQDGGCSVPESARRPPPPPLLADPPRSMWKRDLTRTRSSPSGRLEVMRADDELWCAVQHPSLVIGYPLSLFWSYTNKNLLPHDDKGRATSRHVAPCYLEGEDPATDRNTLPGSDRYFALQTDHMTPDVNDDSHREYRCKASLPDEYDEDDTVPLTCPLHRWPNVKLKWNVKRGAGAKSLLPPIFAQRREGIYSCTKEGNDNTIEPPRMLYPPQSKTSPQAGTVRFNCTAAGNPKPIVKWYKNGVPLVTSSGAINIRNSSNQERLELVVSSLSANSEGVYQCIASNAGGFVSGWAHLNVTFSPVLAPVGVACAPLSANSVQVRWRSASDTPGDLAYTVSVKLKEKADIDEILAPTNLTVYNEIRLSRPLTPYQFQVRTYRKSGASNFSHTVVCQGQGVPFNMSVAGEGLVLVSWKTFAEQNPGVVQWRVEYKTQNNDDVTTVVPPAGAHNYTLRVSPNEPLLVRVLGSRTAEWLLQNLTLVPWVSTTRAGEDYGELDAYVDEVAVTSVRERSVSLRWRCVGCPPRHKVQVCAISQQHPEVCRNTTKTNVTLDELYPQTMYELRLQVVAGRAAGKVGTAYSIVTRSDAQFKELTYKFVNESALLVSWSGAGAYTVHYSSQLQLPIITWSAIEVVGNSVLITGIDPLNKTYVMVTGYDPPARSPVITVPAQASITTPADSEEKTIVAAAKDEIQYEFVGEDVVIRWGSGSRLVRYSQNITRPIEDWDKADSSDGFIQFQMSGFNPSLPLYVQVIGRADLLSGSSAPVLTIPPRPTTTSNFYLNLILGCSFGALCVLVILSAYIWRRRRRLSKSARSRRSHVAASSPEEDGSEMKTVGARLCNGAGEPLLNGHVHITENPASKTPNGRMKRGRRLDSQFEAFDVSRHDADTTQETTLGDSALDLARPGPKLPDDNMNVEGGFRDNSQQPTLQPNG